MEANRESKRKQSSVGKLTKALSDGNVDWLFLRKRASSSSTFIESLETFQEFKLKSKMLFVGVGIQFAYVETTRRNEKKKTSTQMNIAVIRTEENEKKRNKIMRVPRQFSDGNSPTVVVYVWPLAANDD